jgi:hypothetical protein
MHIVVFLLLHCILKLKSDIIKIIFLGLKFFFFLCCSNEHGSSAANVQCSDRFDFATILL